MLDLLDTTPCTLNHQTKCFNNQKKANCGGNKQNEQIIIFLAFGASNEKKNGVHQHFKCNPVKNEKICYQCTTQNLTVKLGNCSTQKLA